MREPAAHIPVPPVTADRVAVPLLDVSRGNQLLEGEIDSAIRAVVKSGRFLHGPEVRDLEERVAALSGAKHAIACASGSDALLIPLMALGLGPGDEVICPSFTFFATASAVWRLGATPVFVDIDPKTYNVDPNCVQDAITLRTRAIIPVHLFGQCADMTALSEIATRHGISVIEDAAQAIGAEHDGRGAGSMGWVGAFSFYPTKNLGGMGDGGLMTCQDDVTAERLRLYANHGMNPRYHHSVVGINSRLDTIQAAILGVKLRWLDTWTAARRRNAALYDKLLTTSGLAEDVTLPTEAAAAKHAWNQYTLRIPFGQRDAVRKHLADRQIGSEIYYPIPLHQQECFKSLGYKPGSLPHTERAAKEVLSLPIFPELRPDEQRSVVEGLASFYRGRQRLAA